MEYSSNGKANAALTTGIIGTVGTGIGLLGNGLGMFGNNYHNTDGGRYITKDELNYAQTIAAKDSEIALLKSEQNTEIKIADVYERIMSRVNADQRAQADWNAAQSVYNATANSAIAVLQNQVGVLNGLTKIVIPNGNVCPGWGEVKVTPVTQ